MTKQELGNWLISKGYIKDQFGHYQKILSSGEVVRCKMQDNSVRYEHRALIFDHNKWLRIKSGYYKNLSITPEGKLVGMKE